MNTMLFIEIAVIFIVAKIGGDVAIRLGQPSVLGELASGIVLGALGALFYPGGSLESIVFEIHQPDSHINMLAEMGVVLLLFKIGLESNLRELVRVGPTAVLVATTGAFLPFVLGSVVCSFWAHDLPAGVRPFHMHLYVGATLAATSVGITVRVFDELQRVHSREAQIVLGAAVIDDVLGLMLLGTVSSLFLTANSTESVSLVAPILRIALNVAAFSAITIVCAKWLFPTLIGRLLQLRGEGTAATVSLVCCFGMAAIAGVLNLAPIIGAFCAGLIMDNKYFSESGKTACHANKDHLELANSIRPIYQVLAPVFFVVMGTQVDLRVLGSVDNFGYVSALVVTGIVTKLGCGVWVKGSRMSKLVVGIGMIPRGEVGLIFASTGLAWGLIGETTFSAVVMTVFMTTLFAPPVLKMATLRLQH